MKETIPSKAIIRIPKAIALMLLSLFIFFQSCYKSDELGNNYYTFTGEMMGAYIKSRPEYSEFAKMLDTTKVIGLLNAYGNYTCFVPNNEAMIDFYKKRGHSSIKDFPYDSIVKVVYDHIIQDAEITTSYFTNGRLTSLSMSDRYISTKIVIDTSGLPVIYVDETSAVLQKDIDVHNGIIHVVNKVLQPTDLRLVEVISKDSKFKLFYKALIATGLDKELEGTVDNSYVPDALFNWKQDPNNGFPKVIPLTRKFGFTALMESDSVYKFHKIITLDDMQAYAKTVYDEVYPNDAGITDITNRKNSLNRFVAYHLLNRQLGYKKIIYDLYNDGNQSPTKTHAVKTYDMFEYIETLCPNTLMEVRTNIYNNDEFGIFDSTLSSRGVRINVNNKDKDALNGVYHEIDNILAYSKGFVSELTTKRLRLDVASFFPEFVNNNFRASKVGKFWIIPRGYIERLKTSDYTVVNYLNSDDRLLDYQGDEIFIPGTNQFDFTITTLPIPAGTYEVRFGYLVTQNRGVTQLYFDGQPCGIPLNLKISSNDARIGNVVPGADLTDPEGYENDKMMRNRGYMKGPASFTTIDPQWKTGPARWNPDNVRRILGIFTFKEDGTHTIRAKSVSLGEFEFDYLEFVPTEILEHEGID